MMQHGWIVVHGKLAKLESAFRLRFDSLKVFEASPLVQLLLLLHVILGEQEGGRARLSLDPFDNLLVL